MARGDQLGRQWKILQMLIDSKTGKSVADIADRLECHTRTIYRDLEALQTATMKNSVAKACGLCWNPRKTSPCHCP